MNVSASSSPLTIGGRYLASAAALEAKPEGPLEALDTSSGRAAQVRIVFASEGWDDDGLAESVARWCALGCAGVCGILDHGDHDGRRFLVVPPGLGMSVERWRATRRPGLAESARLALAFGRLAERIAAAGFPVDAAEVGDFAVGPGPTPFLERPLLGSPVVNPILTGPGGGQRTLAAILWATLASAPPQPLAGWLERSSAAGFPSLAGCLDELERCAGAGGLDPADDAPIGLDDLFEDDGAFEARLLPPEPRRWPQRLAGGLGAAALLALAVTALGHGGGHPEAAIQRPPAPRPVAVGEPPAPRPPHHRTRHADGRVAARPQRRPHNRQPRPHPRSTAPQVPPAAPKPPPPPPATTAGSGGGTSLPDPGQLGTLPAPR